MYVFLTLNKCLNICLSYIHENYKINMLFLAVFIFSYIKCMFHKYKERVRIATYNCQHFPLQTKPLWGEGISNKCL